MAGTRLRFVTGKRWRVMWRMLRKVIDLKFVGQDSHEPAKRELANGCYSPICISSKSS